MGEKKKVEIGGKRKVETRVIFNFYRSGVIYYSAFSMF